MLSTADFDSMPVGACLVTINNPGEPMLTRLFSMMGSRSLLLADTIAFRCIIMAGINRAEYFARP